MILIQPALRGSGCRTHAPLVRTTTVYVITEAEVDSVPLTASG